MPLPPRLLLLSVGVFVLAAACRTTPSPPQPANAPATAASAPTPRPEPAETEPQAVARCAREVPECRFPFAIKVFSVCHRPCGLGQSCENDCVVTPESAAGIWQCMCDLCGSDDDCPPLQFCGNHPCDRGRQVRQCRLKPQGPLVLPQPCSPPP